eukprot:2698469-Pyramimonas_sp.AAC.1
MAAARFTRLESLNLDCCYDLDSNGLRVLVSLFPSLRTLSLCDSEHIRSFSPLSSLTSLTELRLDYTSIGAEDLHALSTLTALQSLSLHEAEYIGEEAELNAVASLTTLTNLDVSSKTVPFPFGLDRCVPRAQLGWGMVSQLTDKSVSALSTLVSLTTLDLGGQGQLTDEGMRSLSTLSALALLNVAESESLTDERMRAVFPRVTTCRDRSNDVTRHEDLLRW